LINDGSTQKIFMQPGLFEQYWYFFILGSSAGENYVYKEVAISVTEKCAIELQVLDLANSGFDEFNFDKNTGVQRMLDSFEITQLVEL